MLESSRHILSPLENGDGFTRIEFEARYAAMPESTRAELIEGVVFIKGKVRHAKHAKPHAVLCSWVGQYMARSSGVEDAGIGRTVRLDDDNEVHPDLLMPLPAIAGGKAIVDADDFISGPPDLVCELAASSRAGRFPDSGSMPQL